MKCYVCNGTGKRFVPTDKNAITGNGYTADCLICNGTGKVDITNEEWFCQLPTGEKAKTIICLAVNSMHKKRKGLIENDVNEIMRWLKEIHDGE